MTRPITKAMVKVLYQRLDTGHPDKSFPWIVSVIESELGCRYEFVIDVLVEAQP